MCLIPGISDGCLAMVSLFKHLCTCSSVASESCMQPDSLQNTQVQDMIDPEYYVGAVRGAGGCWSTNKYSDAAVDGRASGCDMKVLSTVTPD